MQILPLQNSKLGNGACLFRLHTFGVEVFIFRFSIVSLYTRLQCEDSEDYSVIERWYVCPIDKAPATIARIGREHQQETCPLHLQSACPHSSSPGGGLCKQLFDIEHGWVRVLLFSIMSVLPVPGRLAHVLAVSPVCVRSTDGHRFFFLAGRVSLIYPAYIAY